MYDAATNTSDFVLWNFKKSLNCCTFPGEFSYKRITRTIKEENIQISISYTLVKF